MMGMGRYALWIVLRRKKLAMLQYVIRRLRSRLLESDRRSSIKQEQSGQRIVQYIGDALSHAKPRKLERGSRPLRLVHFTSQLGP
jgi:hypothetical protein